MKKHLLTILSLIIVLTFFSCGDSDNGGIDNGSDVQNEPSGKVDFSGVLDLFKELEEGDMEWSGDAKIPTDQIQAYFDSDFSPGEMQNEWTAEGKLGLENGNTLLMVSEATGKPWDAEKMGPIPGNYGCPQTGYAFIFDQQGNRKSKLELDTDPLICAPCCSFLRLKPDSLLIMEEVDYPKVKMLEGWTIEKGEKFEPIE